VYARWFYGKGLNTISSVENFLEVSRDTCPDTFLLYSDAFQASSKPFTMRLIQLSGCDLDKKAVMRGNINLKSQKLDSSRRDIRRGIRERGPKDAKLRGELGDST
jgi:hypothetical protein